TFIYDGISTAMGFGWRAIIIGEVLAQPIHGIGTAMKQAQAFINVSELIAWTVIAVGVSYLFEGIIRLIRKIHFKENLPEATAFEIIKNIQVSEIKIIKIQDIEKRFNDKLIFESFTSVFDNTIVSCIKGTSGKGKTTLLRLIAQLIKADSGNLSLPKSFQLAYSFQDVRLLPWLTVSENIAYVLHNRYIHIQKISNLVTFLLEKMELEEHGHKYPHELSGGQQQRVGLARALAARSDVLLLDEPLTGLDNDLKIRIIDFLSEWISAYRPVVVWATHEHVQLSEFKVREVSL
ncbi:MAG TPA: ATP-binding cassette domain-containing protein, partial [Paludibacter sp.]